MPQLWEPGTAYGLGSIVEFEGQLYKIIQPHTSQGDWTPPVTPALWGHYYEQKHQEPYHEPRHEPHHEQKPWTEQTTQKVDVHEEDRKKPWSDLDADKKKKLEIGGGLAAGLALLGAGYYAYHEHEKNEEDKKAQVWGLQNWLQDAQRRTEEFHERGPNAPTTWVLAHGKNIPQGAIVAGEEHGKVYIARAFYEGSIQVGKAGPQYEKGAVIGYGHKEIHLETYEILLGDSNGIRWIEHKGNLKAYELGNVRLVEGGREANGSPLYIAQAQHDGVTVPGKASDHFDGALIPLKGTEKKESHYKVLAYH
ncbi:carbohydrate-binding module family 12 protein [Sphaerobolus stellatus SS14]|nr:carbohydrate-binding module family 12 protein [Sphaerobolus stellatus SS14]